MTTANSLSLNPAPTVGIPEHISIAQSFLSAWYSLPMDQQNEAIIHILRSAKEARGKEKIGLQIMIDEYAGRIHNMTSFDDQLSKDIEGVIRSK